MSAALSKLNKPMVRQGMATPWGPADAVSKLAPAGDVIKVCTSSHGGIGVHVTGPTIPAALLDLAILEGDWHWFEEDLCWAGPALALPDLFKQEERAAAEETIRHWYPDVYARHFGRRPTAAESRAVAEEELRARTHGNFTPQSAFGDWSWNVPSGHVYVLGYRASDKSTAGFLLTQQDYECPHGLVLDGFPRWEPDRALPYSKPREGRA